MARTRANDFEEKQRLILVSAATVFAEQGMEKASMSQIALHCNVSKALLYHYYPSKGALIFGIIHAHLFELDVAVEEVDDRAMPAEARLRQLIWAVLDNYRDADNQHKVQFNGMDALTDEQRVEIRTIERRIISRFSAAIREINPDLDTKERPLVAPITMSLFGIMNWVYMWFREGGALTREDYADLATTLMLNGIKGMR